jgi:hypothetical protein
MRYLKSALVTPSPKSVRRVSCLPAIKILFCASHVFAAAPAVVVDAQQTLGSINDPLSGTPAINLTGTGTGAGPLVKTDLRAAVQTLPTNNRGRKSFAGAKFK